jgi:spermidine/putrescine transport system substrate-binding protein
MTDELWQRQLWNKKYDRKGFVTVSAMTAFLAACGGSTVAEQDTGQQTTGPAEKKQIEDELFYYNWADYVNPETYKMFRREFDVKIKKDFYASNEDLLAKLQGGARGYDLVVPTGYMVEIMAGEGLLTEIDWSQLPNAQKNLDDQFRKLAYDPEEKYSVPKDWGTTGYTYRTDLVKEKPTSWREFFDLAKGPYSGKVTLLDGIPEVVGSTLKMLGYSYNTEDEGELEEAKQELLDLKPHILAITSTEVRQLLISGRAVIGMTWNGDGAVVAGEKPAEYIVPDEGGEFWVDTYAIPAGNEHPVAAHTWIDFTNRPDINALETSYHYYGSALKRELLEGELDEEILANDDVFPPPEVQGKLEENNYGPEGTKLRDRIWTEFKAA